MATLQMRKPRPRDLEEPHGPRDKPWSLLQGISKVTPGREINETNDATNYADT